jgi:EmrB/QacA subfamily drug resistance transporter
MTRSNRYKYLVFGALGIATFLSAIDPGSVNIAIPTVAGEFQTDLSTIQWLVIAYALAVCSLLLPMGRLSDLIGRKKVYIAGMVVLGCGALAAGLSPNLEVLFSSRVVQGVGAAMTQGTSMAIITSVFPINERGKAIGLIMITVGVGNVVGPAAGGLAVALFGWRAVFLFTVPLVIFGIVTALVVMRGFTEVRDTAESRFDCLGATLSGAILIVLLLALTTGNRMGWISVPIVTYLVAGSCMSAAFIWWELKIDNPILDLRLFRRSTFSLGVASQFLTFVGLQSVLFLMPLYLQNILAYSPRTAGLIMAPGAVCMAAMGSISGLLSDRFGWRPFTVGGLVIAVIGLLALSLVSDSTSLWVLIPALILVSSGLATFYSPNTSSVLSAATREQYGAILGFLNLVRNAGNVTSVASATLIVTTTMGALDFSPTLDALRGQTDGIGDAFTLSLRYAFLIMTGVIFLSISLSAFQKPRPLTRYIV